MRRENEVSEMHRLVHKRMKELADECYDEYKIERVNDLSLKEEACP